MKNFNMLILILGLAISGLSISACTNNKAKTVDDVEAGKEYTSAYICPMHCDGSGSDEAGVCPVCGMDYVKNEDHKSDGHMHEEEMSGDDHTHDHNHDHDDHEGHNH